VNDVLPAPPESFADVDSGDLRLRANDYSSTTGKWTTHGLEFGQQGTCNVQLAASNPAYSKSGSRFGRNYTTFVDEPRIIPPNARVQEASIFPAVAILIFLLWAMAIWAGTSCAHHHLAGRTRAGLSRFSAIPLSTVPDRARRPKRRDTQGAHAAANRHVSAKLETAQTTAYVGRWLMLPIRMALRR